MPRTLPWLAQGAEKKKEKKKEVLSSSPAPRQRQPRKRSSSPNNLVDSDLNDLPDTVPPARDDKKGKKKAFDRSPSTSPVPAAPAAPEVEYMREGFDADDIYMMVEDEFDSTARLFTQHIHHAEYQRLRRLHKSRGEETLRKLGHGTDGRTEQSRALRMKLEAQERAQKRADPEHEEESESDDEYKRDPQLAELMTASQRAGTSQDVSGLAKAKSTTRAAAGYSQSPRKGNKWKKDVSPATVPKMPRMSPVLEDGSTDEDEYDLDAPMRAPKAKSKPTINDSYLRRPEEKMESKGAGFFKPFAKSGASDKTAGKVRQKSFGKSSSPPQKTLNGNKASFTSESNGASSSPHIKAEYKADRSARVAEILARRRQTEQPQSPIKVKQEVKIKEEPASEASFGPTKAAKAESLASKETTSSSTRKNGEVESQSKNLKKRSRVDDIPTFLF